jgi:hypothetical protein
VADATDPGRIPGPIIVPGVIRVRFQWGLPDGRVVSNVLHATVGGGFTPTLAIANAILAALIGDATWTALKPYFHTGTTLSAIGLLDLRTANNVEVLSNGSVGTGTGAGLPLAPQSAAVITLRTAQGGAGFRGRVYIPGWSSAAITAAQAFLGAAQTALVAWAQIWPTVLTTESMTLCLAHPARAGYTGETGTVHAARAAGSVAVTALVSRLAVFSTQRRRAGKT